MANSLIVFTTIYEYLQHLPWLRVFEESPPAYTWPYLKYELITEFLDKVAIAKHENMMTMHMKKGVFDRYKFQSGKSSRLYSFQVAITNLGISQEHSWVP